MNAHTQYIVGAGMRSTLHATSSKEKRVAGFVGAKQITAKRPTGEWQIYNEIKLTIATTKCFASKR